VKAPGELNENLTGSLERSALLDPSEGEESAVAGRINRWPQYAAVAAVLILAIGLAIVVYSVLPPKGSGLVVMNDNAASRPVNDLRDSNDLLKNDLADGAKVGKDIAAEKSAVLDPLGQGDMKDVIVRANGLDVNAVDNARRRIGAGGPEQSTMYCMFVSAENTSAANEQVTAYFRSNGIVYSVNDVGSLDQLSGGRAMRDSTVRMKAEGELEKMNAGGLGGGGRGSAGGGFGGYGVDRSARGGGNLRPTAQPEPDNQAITNAATPAKPEEKADESPAAAISGVGATVDADKAARSVAKPNETVAPKGVADDTYAQKATPAPAPADVREESKNKTEMLTAPSYAKAGEKNYGEALTLNPGQSIKSGERVIVARMSRKQLDELQSRITSQAGQSAQLSQEPLRELRGTALTAELYKKQQQGQNQPTSAGQVTAGLPQNSELSITPKPAQTTGGEEAQLLNRADRTGSGVAATRSASRPFDGANKFAEPAAPRSVEALDNPTRAFAMPGGAEDLLDVVIVVKGGEAAASKVNAAGAAPSETKPADPNAK
jgi:hypothetical protein